MVKMKRTYVLIIFPLLLALSINMLFSVPRANQPYRHFGEVRVSVLVEQYRDGQLIKRVYEKSDPFTENFAKVLAMIFYNGSPTATKSCYGPVVVTAIDGTTRTLCSSFRETREYTSTTAMATWDCICCEVPFYAKGVKIYIGSSSAPFSPSNYSLGSPIANASASEVVVTYNTTSANFTVSASFSISSDVTIREVGLTRYFREEYSEDIFEALLLRDVLSSPINAVAGDTVTVTYIITISG